MIKIHKAAGVEYYTGAGSSSERMVPSYYTGASEKGEPAGQWSGRLAADLGLTGEVDAATMDRLYNHYQAPDGSIVGRPPMRFRSIEERIEQALAEEPNALPERVEQIAAEVARSARSSDPGKDLTTSIQKSVTVAHTAAWRAEVDATRSGDLDRAEHFRSIRESIEGAILESNAAGLEAVARAATSRIGSGSQGTVTWVPAPDIAVASFFQHTSRADDPQLHVHNVVLNKARNADGAIRGIDFQDLGRQRFIYSAVQERVLAERMADLGIAMELRPDRVAREIVGVDEDIMEKFSQRRQAVTKAAAPLIERAQERLGRDLSALEVSRIKQTVTLVTRQSKSGITDPDALLDLWQDRLISELATGLGPTAERLSLDITRGPVERDVAFSPSAVAARALEAVSEKNAAWTRAELMLEIEKELPLLGLSNAEAVEMLDAMTDFTIEHGGVTQVSGSVGIAPPEGLFQGSLVPQSAVKYAAPTTLNAERLIREAAIVRGREHLDAAAMNAWLDERYPKIGADQRAAVVGIASSDAALAQLIGPAGTGKSYTAGALTGGWEELKGGRVHGLAVSQNAAEILREDGIVNSANVTAWLASQDRLEAGDPMAVDCERAVGPRDIVLVDEASMVGTAELDRVRDIVDSIGARMVLMGDPRQLGPVGAGGAMGLLEGRAETYTLTDVRRFDEQWEGAASLRLREGDRDVLAEYDKHGRLVEAESLDEAIERTARAVAADRIAGLSVIVSADTNEIADRISNAVREQLEAAGIVEAEGVPLPRTGGVAGIGDEIMTRKNDYGLEVINRERFKVVGTGEQGSLSVLDEDGVVHELPASYVTEHVQLAYGSTVHASQGSTVDRGYVVTDGRSDISALYVGMSRGRERNTAIVALSSPDAEAGEMVSDPAARPTARSVLEDCLEREAENRAAMIEAEADAERVTSMKTVLGNIEHATGRATRFRMESDLDRLVAEGVLSTEDRARLASDQASAHLARLLRAGEQAGHDPADLLREAIAQRPLEGSQSVAQVLSHRITSTHDIEAAQLHRTPERLAAEHSEYLEKMREQAADRTRELGCEVAEQQPAWATKALGAVPEDAMERLEWEAKAGSIAAYREAAGFDDAERAIPSAPSLTNTEKRAAWWDAWEALGQPSETRAEAALSDGKLQARVAAWQREQTWAPAHADASLRKAELDAEAARTDAILAEAQGDAERAAERQAEAERQAAIARGMTEVAEARADWAAETAVTRDLAERAERELNSRGLTPGAESDRVSAEEWLEEHRRSVDAEDEIRPVTEADMSMSEPDDELAGSRAWSAPADQVNDQPSRAHERAPIEPDDLELEALVHTAVGAEDEIADRESQEAAHEAMEAEIDVAPGLDGLDLDDVAELPAPVSTGGAFKPWPEND